MTSTHETAEASDTSDLQGHGHGPNSLLILALGSLGVVYGDIGTSPLYALREAIKAAANGGAITSDIIFGVLSLIIWSLVLVVTVKYVLILLNADNKGEGGTLSLMALAQRGRGKFWLTIPVLGMTGAALFYGDAIITPAISVLSAIEGLNILTPAFEQYTVWITLVIIVVLFAVQSHGTAKVANFFGPITLVWFAALAAAGAANLIAEPHVLWSVSPLYAISFLNSHGTIGLVTLGAVFLAVTGAEALYADLGHFGKRPIRLAWLIIVLPSLVLNYLGQGALLLSRPEAIENPFFLMVPDWALLPMVGLATAATIIASQAVITGAYSLTRQAVQLGLFPRMRINFTSSSHAGQIYMPQVNWILLAGVIILTLTFKSSSNLATAYGIAVTGTMVVTALLAIYVIRNRWKWPLPATLAVMLPLLALDLVFLGANSLKILEGGWLPLALGFVMMIIMWTWRSGTRQIREKTRKMETPLAPLVRSLANSKSLHRISGTAVYFTADTLSAPTALLHSLKHYKVLHARNCILTVKTADTPYTNPQSRVRISDLSDSFQQITISFGFFETPDVPKALKEAGFMDANSASMETTYFLSRRNLQPSQGEGMPLWQDRLFILLARNADDASSYFHLPADRVVELGSRLTI